MQKIHKQAVIGLSILIPIILSMIFIGISSNASQNNNLGLNQSEATSVAKAQIWLELVIDGNTIQGDSSVRSLDREGKIEIWSFRMDIQTPVDQTGRISGKRQYSPIVVTKLLDQSSPLLMAALTRSENVNEATFRFYRPSPSGDGQTEQYYTVKIETAKISAIRMFTLTDFSTHVVYDMEEISFIFQKISITYEVNGAENVDDGWAR